MKDNNREHLIEVTTELIREYDGDVKRITARAIAQKAGAGLGLINYHFGSKEQLITECVQRFISQVMHGVRPDITHLTEDGLTDQERLIHWAVQIYDFLYDNHAIAKISILGDMQNYQFQSNSVLTQKGLSIALTEQNQPEKIRILTFMLVSSMQTAFLCGDAAKDILGYDLQCREERIRMIRDFVTMLME